MAKKAKPAAPSSAPVKTSTNPQSTAPAALCSFTRWEEVSKVVSNPRNPNRHSEDQISRIVKVIAALGWRAPITISSRSGFVVRGHGRLAAATFAGWTHVPIDVQAYESEAQEWADMIADNRLAELSERDAGALKDLMGEIGDAVDIEAMGFTEGEMEKMMEAVAAPDDFETFDETVPVSYCCPKCGYSWSGKTGDAMVPDAKEEGEASDE